MRISEQIGTRRTHSIVPHRVDPEELWLDLSIGAEELVHLDRLEVTPEMVEQGEHPELADPVWALIREGSSGFRGGRR